MNKITKNLLEVVSDLFEIPEGAAYNIREDGGCAGRQSSKNIKITSKTDVSGIDIRISAACQGEKVFIPACITKSNVDDLVYNDFYIEDGANVIIVAGCGVHTDGEEGSQHNGIHRFFVGKNAWVRYEEKHFGEGTGTGARVINPQTEITMAEGSYMEMDTVQIKGVDSTVRTSRAVLDGGARLVIKEKIMTHGAQTAETNFSVDLNGADCGVDLVSRSVARDFSRQKFLSTINGNNKCSGHSSCDAIIMDDGVVAAVPSLTANHVDAALIHEAAIGKIAGEQLIKLMTLGLTPEEAEEKIIEGFLK